MAPSTAKLPRPSRLAFVNAAEDIPRLITGYLRRGDEYVLILRPTEGQGHLFHMGKEGGLYYRSHQGEDAPTTQGRWPHDVVTQAKAVSHIKAAKKGLPKVGPITLRSQWKGTLDLDPSGRPVVELRRKLNSYGELVIRSSQTGWLWEIHRGKRWFGEADRKSGFANILVNAIGEGVAAAMGLMGEACATRDMRRRGALDAEYRKQKCEGDTRRSSCPQPARERKNDPADRLKVKKPRSRGKGKEAAAGGAATKSEASHLKLVPAVEPAPVVTGSALLGPANQQHMRTHKRLIRFLKGAGLYERFAFVDPDTRERVAITLKNGTYQDLAIEWVVTPHIEGFPDWKLSLAHYTEQNGDRFADIEVVFGVRADGRIIDHRFIAVGGRPMRPNRDGFMLSTWFKNLRAQEWEEAARAQLAKASEDDQGAAPSKSPECRCPCGDGGTATTKPAGCQCQDNKPAKAQKVEAPAKTKAPAKGKAPAKAKKPRKSKKAAAEAPDANKDAQLMALIAQAINASAQSAVGAA